MEKLERNIDCLKYRKSTHLAGVDVDIIVHEKGSCILKIKDAYFNRSVDVSGNSTDGYFLEFEGNVKPMVVNSTNRKVIARIVKDQKKLNDTESRNIGNWIGLTIELYFDSTVKMMGKKTGGIKVKEKAPRAMNEKELNVLKGKIAVCLDLGQLTTLYNSDIKYKTNTDAMDLFKLRNHELTTE